MVKPLRIPGGFFLHSARPALYIFLKRKHLFSMLFKQLQGINPFNKKELNIHAKNYHSFQ
jgi:hypothetical protein